MSQKQTNPDNFSSTVMLSKHISDGEGRMKPDDSDTSQPEPQEQEATQQQENPESSNPFEKRYFDLKAHHDQTVSSLREELKQATDQIKDLQKSNMKPPKTPEEMEEFRREWPDVYDVMMSITLQNSDKVSEQFRAELESLRQEKQRVEQEIGAQKILAKHPDANQVANQNNKQFMDWLNSKSKGVQSLFGNKATPEDIIEGLDLFKKEVKQKSSDRNNSLEQSLQPNTTGGASPEAKNGKKVWKESEVEAGMRRDPNHFWERFGDEIEAARKEGRFEYDGSRNRYQT